MTTEELNAYIARMFGMSDSVIDQMNGHVDREMILLYKKNLKDVQSKLAKMYENFGDNVTLADMNKYGRLKALQDRIKEQITDLGKEVKKMVTGSVKDNFSEAYYHAGYAMETPVNINLGFSGLNPDTVRAAVINPYDAIKWPERLAGNLGTLNRHIKESVTRGLIQGDGYAKTARAVRDSIERSAYESKRIIWTESHRAKSMGRNLAFEKSQEAGEILGIEVKKIWDATLDSRTRPEHGRLDGKAAKEVDEEFIWKFSDGVTTRGPSLSGVAKHDIQCRCNTFTQVGDIKPDFRRDNMAKKEIPYTDYEEWAKNNGINMCKN